jgi:hypothetical protein
MEKSLLEKALWKRSELYRKRAARPNFGLQLVDSRNEF